MAILRPTWSCQVRPPPSVSNLQSCLAPVFDLYGEQSESGKYKCGISFSNRKFGTFHHLSPCGKSFGNFVHRVQRRHWISWWIGFAPIGVSPWFSATTRRLFGRVCRRKPLAELAIPHSRAHPLLDEAPRATPPRRTARPNPGLHLTRNHPGGTRPRQFPRGEAQVKKMFALRQQTALLAGASVTGPRGSTAARARSTARRPVRVSAVATEQIGKVRFIPPHPPTVHRAPPHHPNPFRLTLSTQHLFANLR